MGREREVSGRATWGALRTHPSWGQGHQPEATGSSSLSTCGLLSSRVTTLSQGCWVPGTGARDEVPVLAELLLSRAHRNRWARSPWVCGDSSRGLFCGGPALNPATFCFPGSVVGAP